ncbi:MAG: efflux RND transporter permease subunit, partial [Spongiibacteraceae bacterium]|nr:efflux RND transporter permease subunit [Spongiibacteraceae bacterium]
RAATELNVRQYPLLENALITVTTPYIGADADLVQGFITTPLEREIAKAEGIDYIASSSVAGTSVINIHVHKDADPDEVLTQVSSRVNKLRNEMPEGAEDSSIDLKVGETLAAIYLGFYSDTLSVNQLTDYVIREVEPKFATIPGVQSTELGGARSFAMRIWLKPERMAAFGLTGGDVATALRNNNILSAVGSSKGSMMMVDLTATTDLQTVEQFQRLVVRQENGAIVRLGDIATVELGSDNYSSDAMIDGRSAVDIGIHVATDASALTVIDEVNRLWHDEILPQLPHEIEGMASYDSTVYIRNAINEVMKTIVEAVIIVIVVIFLFLGSLRSVLIPAVTVPLSLIGALFLMLLMGFSINLLTLLAMVLGIGIVVDDAIIVLENIHRHIEAGEDRLSAALQGARELAWPVVAMTTTLVAVYLPIGFVGGMTGTLFTEFAFTLAGSVLLSGVVALTLSPMMCSKMLRASGEGRQGRLEAWLDHQFERLRQAYQRDLDRVLEQRGATLALGAVVLVSCYLLFVNVPEELAPGEDLGLIFHIGESDPNVTLEYLTRFAQQYAEIAATTEGSGEHFMGIGMGMGATGNAAFGGFVLRPWEERDLTAQQILDGGLQQRVEQVTGYQTAALVPSPLPTGGSGLPVEFVIGSTSDPEVIQETADQILERALQSGKFIFLNTDTKIDRVRQRIVIDRDKAALLGIDMATVSRDLSAMLSGAYVNRFSSFSRSYDVIPQAQRIDRLTPEALMNYYTRTASGDLIPLSTIVRLEREVEPQSLNRFQQLNAVTLTGVPRPGVILGDALAELEAIAAELLPAGFSIDYAGESRQFKREGSSLLITFLFALLVIYLVLSAQFESFRDPLIMLVTVPMSISGALLVLNVLAMFQLPGASLNIYSQVGLLTLVGVISKHGILIVEFANRLQQQGLSKRTAIAQAAAIRLRPVLMTTAALVLAMVPLLIASGPGANARFSMGVVIAAGMTIGTLFTMYILPGIYLLIGRDYGGQADELAETPGAAAALPGAS